MGHDVAETLKKKNGGSQLYSAFLFLAISKNLKFMYLNLDSILVCQRPKDFPYKMTCFDKIYGQQSFIVASSINCVGSQLLPYLQCLTEFRQNYVTHMLNRVFEDDLILKAQLGILKNATS